MKTSRGHDLTIRTFDRNIDIFHSQLKFFLNYLTQKSVFGEYKNCEILEVSIAIKSIK